MGSTARGARYGVMGVVVCLIGWQATRSLPSGVWQQHLYLPLLFALAGVVFVLPAVMPGAAKKLLRHRRLLLPLLLLTLIEAGLAYLERREVQYAFLTPFPPLELGFVHITIDLPMITSLVVRVGYAAWVMTLVMKVARESAVGTLHRFVGLGRFYFRTACLLALGWSVPFFSLAVAVALGLLNPEGGNIVRIGLAVIVYLWSLLTAALLPVALDERLSFGEAVAAGFRVSRQGIGRWWLPVTFQMLLLGLWTYPAWAVDSQVATGERFTWQVHALWTGGFEHHCHWYTDLLSGLRVRPVPVIDTLLGLASGVFAVAVKLHIAGRLPPGIYVIRRDRAAETRELIANS